MKHQGPRSTVRFARLREPQGAHGVAVAGVVAQESEPPRRRGSEPGPRLRSKGRNEVGHLPSGALMRF